MSAPTGLLTVEEFLKLSEPREGRIELHRGEVVVVPPPKRGHQRMQNRIHMLIKQGRRHGRRGDGNGFSSDARARGMAGRCWLRLSGT